MPTEAPPPDPDRDTTSPAAVALRTLRSPTATRREREDAAETMLKSYRPWINRHLRRWPRDRREDIEDVVQETLRRFCDPTKLRSGHPYPEAWLRRTFVNLIHDLHQLRNGPNGLCVPIDTLDAESPGIGSQLPSPRTLGDPADLVSARDLFAKAKQAVLRLRPQDIQMFMLYAEARPGVEIAQQLGLDPGVVRQRMHHLRRFLRRALKLQSRGDLT